MKSVLLTGIREMELRDTPMPSIGLNIFTKIQSKDLISAFVPIRLILRIVPLVRAVSISPLSNANECL